MKSHTEINETTNVQLENDLEEVEISNKNSKTKLILIMILGNIIVGLGISLFRVVGLGVDPYTSMIIGLSQAVSIPLGVFQMMFNMIILLVLFRKSKHLIGVGTVINMFLLGYLVQYFSEIFEKMNLLAYGRITLLIFSLIVIVIGISLFMCANLGVGPYDLVALILTEVGKLNFGINRVITDGSCVIVALIIGGEVGISTLIIAFGTGPLVQLCNTHFTKKYLIKGSMQ